MKLIYLTIIYSVLFLATRQSQLKLGFNAVKAVGKSFKSPLIKTIGTPIKDTMNMFRQNTNAMKNIASNIGEKFPQFGHNYGNNIRYVVEEGMRKFGQRPQFVGFDPQFINTKAKRNGIINTVFQMGKNSKNFAANKAARQKHAKLTRQHKMKKAVADMATGNIPEGATANMPPGAKERMAKAMADMKAGKMPEGMPSGMKKQMEKALSQVQTKSGMTKEETMSMAAAQVGKTVEKMVQGKSPALAAVVKTYNILDKYTQWLVKKPLQSRVATSFVLFGLGDFLCQAAVEKRGFMRKNPYIYSRTTRMSLIGGFIAGPMMWGHLNFFLPKVATLGFLKTAGHWPKTAACLLADQTIWAYSFNSFMIFQLDFCENWDVKRAWDKQLKIMPTVIIDNWKVWPAIQIINLGLLPPVYRLPVVNVASIFWNLYLSNANQKSSNAANQIEKGHDIIEIPTE